MIEISGLAGTLLLLAPFAVLLLTVVACLRRTSKTVAKTKSRAAVEPLAAARVLTAASAVSDAVVVVRPDAKVVHPPPEPWLERIRAAEERKDVAVLPALYLSLGQEEIARGNAEEGAGYLRSCIRAAARARNAGAEAEARLELAELARASGDLTTACEHWQIARSLFHKLERAADLASAEDRMRRHGCPTDWVLTDF